MYSPCSASMICSSRPVPSVATTSACVSPRVKSAEPCVRGSTPARIGDRTHGARVAAVDARLAVEDLAAHDLRLEVEEDVLDQVRIRRRVSRRFAGANVSSTRLQISSSGAVRACFCLMPNAARRSLSASCAIRATSASSFAGGLPVPRRLAGFVGKLVDRVDRRLHLLVAEDDGAEHHLLGQLLRLGLDHQHGLLGARDDEVELRFLELGRGRVQHVLAVQVSDASGPDRAVERHARERERRRNADHRRNVGIDLGVRPTSPSRRPGPRCRSRRGRAAGSAGRSAARSASPSRTACLRA